MGIGMDLIMSFVMKKNERNPIFQGMPLISVIFLLGAGVQFDFWIIAVILITVIKISFGEILRYNVKRNPKLAKQYLQSYRKTVKDFRKIRGIKIRDRFGCVDKVPLPKNLRVFYFVLIGFFLVAYLYTMSLTYAQASNEATALFAAQFIAIAYVYSSVFIGIFGKISSK